MVYGDEYGGDVKKTEARYFLMVVGRDQFIVERDKKSIAIIIIIIVDHSVK